MRKFVPVSGSVSFVKRPNLKCAFRQRSDTLITLKQAE